MCHENNEVAFMVPLVHNKIPPQPVILITPTMQEISQSQLAQAPTQQQCHLPILEIQRLAITNKVLNATKRAKWAHQHLEDAMDRVEGGHTSL